MFQRDLSDGLSLRLPRENEAEQIFALTEANRDYLARWLAWVPNVRCADDTADWIKKSHSGFEADDKFDAVLCLNDRPIGAVGLHHRDAINHRAEVGYWLAERFQGRGLMSRACGAWVDYAIRELKIHRVEIRCAQQNIASRGVAQRLGFIEEATLVEAQKIGDRWLDSVVYRMLAQDWKLPAPTK
jgi:ribosomal-protein-serine acetyltransferase